LPSITRQDLGPYKLKVTVIPTVYFVTIIIVDFIMYSVRGRTAFNVADFDKGDPIELRLSSWERLLLVVCAVSLAVARHVCPWVSPAEQGSVPRRHLSCCHGISQPPQLHSCNPVM
jgi:hypothetical protein